jgi:hypothetical protein
MCTSVCRFQGQLVAVSKVRLLKVVRLPSSLALTSRDLPLRPGPTDPGSSSRRQTSWHSMRPAIDTLAKTTSRSSRTRPRRCVHSCRNLEECDVD